MEVKGWHKGGACIGKAAGWAPLQLLQLLSSSQVTSLPASAACRYQLISRRCAPAWSVAASAASAAVAASCSACSCCCGPYELAAAAAAAAFRSASSCCFRPSSFSTSAATSGLLLLRPCSSFIRLQRNTER